MSATEELIHEHTVVKRMLTIIQAAEGQAARRQELPADFIPRVVDFIRNFVDRCHHGKEEDNLFPMMENRGIPKQGGPIAVMLMEHDQGRAYVRKMDEAGKRLAGGEKGALQEAFDNGLAYVQLLTQHIYKEDNILFPMADRALTPEDQKQLLSKFEEVELERIGPGGHEKYLKLVDDLESQIGISHVRNTY